MQQKDQGLDQSQAGQRDRANSNYDRTQSGQNGDNSSAQSDQQGQMQSDQQGQSSDQIPQRSMPSVGHPEQGGQTGQFGVKKFDESGHSEGSFQPESR